MTLLLEKEQKFSHMLALLILHAEQLGYKVTMGYVYRCEDCTEKKTDSLHKKHLAADLNLFNDDVYLTKTQDHKLLGKYWESIGGTWGGRWGDGNHYSLEHEGMK